MTDTVTVDKEALKDLDPIFEIMEKERKAFEAAPIQTHKQRWQDLEKTLVDELPAEHLLTPTDCRGCGLCCKASAMQPDGTKMRLETYVYGLREIREQKGRVDLRKVRMQFGKHAAQVHSSAKTGCCSYLKPNNDCSVFATRPNTCASYPRGNMQCRWLVAVDNGYTKPMGDFRRREEDLYATMSLQKILDLYASDAWSRGPVWEPHAQAFRAEGHKARAIVGDLGLVEGLEALEAAGWKVDFLSYNPYQVVRAHFDKLQERLNEFQPAPWDVVKKAEEQADFRRRGWTPRRKRARSRFVPRQPSQEELLLGTKHAFGHARDRETLEKRITHHARRGKWRKAVQYLRELDKLIQY